MAHQAHMIIQKIVRQDVDIKLQVLLMIVMDFTAHAYQERTESQFMTEPDDIN